MKNRVELCCHTKMSSLQGINDVSEYIAEAINRGYKSIAITDVDSTQGFFEAYDYLKNKTNNKDFKIIYGSEMHFKVSKNSDKVYTIYIYIKEQKGLKNLYKLISMAYRNIEKGVPTLYKKDLINNKEGLLFASIGNQSEVYQNIDDTNIDSIMDFYDFVGIEPNESNEKINLRIYNLCKKKNKMLIGASECDFIKQEDSICNEVLNYYKGSSDIEHGNNNYFHSTEELLSYFNYLENAEEIVIDNPIKIAEQIKNIDLLPKELKYPEIENSDKIITKKCYEKAKEIYGEKLPIEVEERLQIELHSIIDNNFESIYLISSELVHYSNELGYGVCSRGSVGNSFVAYLLGITQINPLDFNLPFEFFAGKNYDKEPDIDLNFSRKIQSKIFSYLHAKYGKERIVWGGTVGSLADKTIEKTYNEYLDTFEIIDNNDKETIIRKLVGIKTCTGEHPGGIFIIPEDIEITDICPTEIGEKNHIKTHMDYHSIWGNGLYKFDILGHDDPTMIYELEKETNTNSEDIELDDEDTLKLFLHANDNSYPISMRGIPEFGTSFVKNILEIVKPKSFDELVYISALSHGSDTWTNNADNLIKNEHKKLNEVISNREDMFYYLVNHGIETNIAFDSVEFVRTGKASRKKDIWNEYKKILKKNNIPDWYINEAEKISYLFPKAHSIGYTINAFKITWYKVHYPKAFYKVYFKTKSDLKINDYISKEQVKQEIKTLYDLNKNYMTNEKDDFYYNNKDKIKDLELMLEMYNCDELKDK